MLWNWLRRVIPEWHSDVAIINDLESRNEELYAKLSKAEKSANRYRRLTMSWKGVCTGLEREIKSLKNDLNETSSSLGSAEGQLARCHKDLEAAKKEIALTEVDRRRWQADVLTARTRDQYIEEFLSSERRERLEKIKAMEAREAFRLLSIDPPKEMPDEIINGKFDGVLCSLKHAGIPKEYGEMMEAINRYLLLPYTATLKSAPYLHSDRF